MRIGVMGHGFMTWGGGIDFLRTVMSSMLHADDHVELHLLMPTRGPRIHALNAARRTYRSARAMFGRKGHSAHLADSHHLLEMVATLERPVDTHEIDIGASAIDRVSRRLSLHALIPAFSPLPQAFAIPWVGYLYDYQHRYYPELFTAKERARRDQAFARMLEHASTVIVNSRAVAEDAKQFNPGTRARVFALPFNAAPVPTWLKPGQSPAHRLGITKPYFIICNQFWKHKDHETAFDAFARFAVRHADVDLVCTGTTSDYRHPEHVPALLRRLAQDRITDRVHILGMVSKADQIELLKGSIALIQPTLFEGGPGGGAAYDAVSLGVRCVLSDIAVNREIADEPGISLFAARDAAALAQALDALASRPSSVDQRAEALTTQGHLRRAACGTQILAAVDYARAHR